MAARSYIPDVALHIDTMADSAQIDLHGLRVLLGGKSRQTIYRWVQKGFLPKPHKLCSNNNFWTVGEIRATLAGGRQHGQS
jgi:hypothetical protein